MLTHSEPVNAKPFQPAEHPTRARRHPCRRTMAREGTERLAHRL